MKDYLATGNGTAAVKKNYAVANEKVAGVMASENLGKPSIVKSIQEALSDALLLEKHTALLEKMDERGGIDVPAVSKGLDMAYKIKGTYAPEKNINVNIESHPSDRIKELAYNLNYAKQREEESVRYKLLQSEQDKKSREVQDILSDSTDKKTSGE